MEKNLPNWGIKMKVKCSACGALHSLDALIANKSASDAFMTLGQTCDWFPTPKQLLEALPQREYPELPPSPPKTATQIREEQAMKQRNLVKLREMMGKCYAKSK